ncbi:MAG: ABC transporter ATP-binding protein [Lentimicrobiaceae bacterium]|nr:ABC transporter ATP-binding protein [Lentimicrobiaceae bacterium]MBT3454348.1 ABC transporter ATP-binding protein [Lentimicrobiaceae bacterium]MBT3817928.1 ABC transporter ATP-binding protein [Lentimicrobiaceae bacterium]MBT4061566.1 ABC transporter ATP-binding protein [Lentimicrobiaceae bacterium]MBT4189856.1 ABC transporter ATP-binding protein [Lentimicrobiaceae bacterium]
MSLKSIQKIALLKIENLKIEFGKTKSENIAVENINLSLAKGKALGIVGESGSGKSITALAIIGLLPPKANITQGSIEFEGVDLLLLSKRERRKYRGQKISMIFQEPMTSLNPVMRCGKQVQESIILNQQLNKKQAKELTIELFEKVNLPRPKEIYKSYPHQLSGGQKQRIIIAMAIANNPDILIADEPTTALDVTVQKEIISLLKDLRDEYEMGLIFISHDLGVIKEVADDVMVMYDGKVVETGSVNKIFNSPKHPYTKGLLACRPSINTNLKRLPEIDDIVNGQNHLEKSEKKIHHPIGHPKPTLDVIDLTKKYTSKRGLIGNKRIIIKAVDNISFKVYPGETLGLVGESGCGKTTLSRAILRLIEPNKGSVFFNEKNLMKLNKASLKDQRKKINIIFQDPYSSLNPRICIGEAIMEPMLVHKLYGNNQIRKNRVLELLEKVGLREEHYNRFPHEFSGGQRQRIVIARTLALNPKFIICDEAVSALDVSVQAKVLNLLNDLKDEFGFTYIFISHDLNVVRYMSDRLIVMKDGKIVEVGNADQIYNNPSSDYTKSLIDAVPIS